MPLAPLDTVDPSRLSPSQLAEREVALARDYASTCATLESADAALPPIPWDAPTYLRARVLELAEFAERIERALVATRSERASRVALVG